MVVNCLRIELHLPGARSLKDKRAVIRSLTDKIWHGFRASIAEVDDHELWGNATLGVALVSNDAAYGEAVLRKIQDLVEDRPEVEIVGSLSEAVRPGWAE